MKNYPIARPSALPAAVCAPLSAVPAAAHASRVVPVAVPAQRPQVHQVRFQPELLTSIVGRMGTNGFLGDNGMWSGNGHKTDVVRGVPPRGRPV